MKKNLLLVLAAIFLIISCSPQKANKDNLLILLSKDKYGDATSWTRSLDSTATIVVMFGMPNDSIDMYLQKADAIIMTGGEDIHPSNYNKPELEPLCGTTDPYRDSLEIAMIKYAFANQTPILGICRGHQLMNIVNGGTLFADIPTVFSIGDSIHDNKIINSHSIVVVEDSWIERNFETQDPILVNTRHHQSVDQMAPNFKLAATSPDGIIESMELIDPTNHFAIGVQWHPEDIKDDFAAILGNMLLDEARAKKFAVK